MKTSAGLLLYKFESEVKFLLVHPGGPFFAKKDEGWWTIPKGELMAEETPLEAAIREFEEETGYKAEGPFIELQPILQTGGKKVLCWACEGELDSSSITSNFFTIEWPPKSGKPKQFPEVDKAGWFSIREAKVLINEKQRAFLDELEAKLKL